jgi:hypothetical protein
MKIRLVKETNHVTNTILYKIEKFNKFYWDNLCVTNEGPHALIMFSKLKELDNEVTKEILQEFEKKVTK